MAKRRFIEFFSFTKKERNGIIVLIFICIVLIGLRSFVVRKSHHEINTSNTVFLAELERFEESLKLKEINTKQDFVSKTNTEEWKTPEKLFVFDPNSAIDSDFIKLGFTTKQISTILKYREKGGRFINKIDLLKIYGITKKQYDSLEPFIQIVQNENNTNHSKKELGKTKKINLIEINSASESDLMELSGVGESYAKRICKYREILGGFYCKEQLLEVYGMDTTRFNQFLNQFFIDTALIVKQDLNTVKYNDLIKRQYLNKYQVQAILKYRELKGNYYKLDELLENNLVPENVYKKVKPYFIIR